MSDRLSHSWLVAALCVSAWGCGDAAEPEPDLPYARHLESFEAGEGAGHGQSQLPDIVLGPPGSPTDALSLGSGGTIVLDFRDRVLVDGEGADFVVFENPFETPLEDDGIWEELGEVSVSEDGANWTTFRCDPAPSEDGEWPGCAGWQPVADYDPRAVVPIDPEITGGDAFDLAEVGVERARYVRIRDLSEEPNHANAAGFDLNAIGLVHFEEGNREPK